MRILLILSIFMSLNAFAKKPRHSTEKLLQTLNMDKMMSRTLDQIIKQQLMVRPQFALIEKEYRALLEKGIGWRAVKTDIIKLWEKTYSAREIDELTDFYLTPVGKKSIEVMPQLTQQGMMIGQQKMQGMTKEIQELQKLLAKRVKAQEKKKKK